MLVLLYFALVLLLCVGGGALHIGVVVSCVVVASSHWCSYFMLVLLFCNF